MSAPQEVQHWWESLDFLAPDVREDMGRLISQLERRLNLTAPASTNEQPAGWSGVARRGPWSRLLPSEWALAETSPDEFARRADEGELSFWELAQEESESHHAIWVWLDVGPDQLGACRLVQIAILLWLQKVAMRGGGQFYWSCIQSSEKAYESLGASELKSFLDSRSLDPPSRSPLTFPGLSVWCVGSPEWTRQVPRNFRRLALSQEDESRVTLTEGTTRLSLSLPAGQRAVRLLREPLAWGLRRKVATSPGGEGRMAFSECGRKLLFVTNEVVSVLPLPQSTNAPPGRLRHYPLYYPGCHVVAVSMQGGAINVVQSHEGSWSFYWLNPPQADQRRLVSGKTSAPDPVKLGTCWRHWPERWYVWVERFLYQPDPSQGRLSMLDRSIGGTELGLSSVLVTSEGTIVNAFQQTLHTFEEHELPQKVYLAPRYPLAAGGVGQAMACLMPSGRWRLHWLEETVDLYINGDVLGVVRDDVPRLALLVQTEERLRLRGADWSEAVELGGRVKEALLHPRGVLAYRTHEGDTGVYSFILKKPLWMADR